MNTNAFCFVDIDSVVARPRDSGYMTLLTFTSKCSNWVCAHCSSAIRGECEKVLLSTLDRQPDSAPAAAALLIPARAPQVEHVLHLLAHCGCEQGRGAAASAADAAGGGP